MSLVIVGSVAFDDVETPNGSAENILAGSATYLSLSAALFVENPKIIGVVGGDFQKEHLDVFKSKNINTTGLEVVSSGKTFRWKGLYHKDLNTRDTIYTHLNVFEHFRPTLPSSYVPVKFLSLGNIDPDLQLSVLEQAKPQFVIGDTMDLWINIKLDSLKKVIKNLNCLIINDSEARLLTGENNLITAAKWIQQLGCRNLVIKKGEHGAMLFYGDDIFSCPAFPTDKVKDPTGAGDCFAGGFVGHIASTADVTFNGMKQAMLYGTVAASYCIQEFGTKAIHAISKQDIESRLGEFKRCISV